MNPQSAILNPQSSVATGFMPGEEGEGRVVERRIRPSPIDPRPSTLDPRPSTLGPRPSTLDHRPSTIDPRPSTIGPRPSTLLLLACLLLPAPGAAAFHPDRLQAIDAAVATAIAAGKCPGGVVWLEHDGAVYHKAYGQRARLPHPEAMTVDTIFDAASLTKVVATTPAIMLLVERGQLDPGSPVAAHIPECTGGGRAAITVQHLLTHTSGLRAGISRAGDWSGHAGAVAQACAEEPQTPPGAAYRYSDVNFILLGEIVRRVSGEELDTFVARELYTPLGMADTGFRPPADRHARVAPTTVRDGVALRAVVHDPTARRMGGVAGHAGLFTTAADLARFARMLLNGGELEGVRIFRPATVARMTSVQTPPALDVRRGFGWDIDSPHSGPRGRHFPVGSYGHTGWTGASLWIEPFSRSFLIFLSNRNHPTEAGSVVALRAELATLAAEAIAGFNFTHVPGALPRRPASATQPRRDRATRNGIDVLSDSGFAPLAGLRVGLITNHTGHDRARNPTIDLLARAPEVDLVVLFSPEHGIRGELDERIGDSVDAQTGLPIHSLYGADPASRKPDSAQLAGLDALVFDIQDIGCRFYTYISTMGLAIEAAGAHGKKIFVLDRANPINGVTVEGPMLAAATSFVGFHHLPLRHGMTVGELARMFNAERGSGADLTVIPLENWERGLWLDETGLPWSNPSPNMRSLKQAILYPGIGLLERALSVGRGTDTPFEVVGAPYIDDVALAAELNAAGLPGVRFVPIRFTPKASVHQDAVCGGVYILLTDRDRCQVVDVGIQIALTLYRLYPDAFDPARMAHLLLDPATLAAIKADAPLAAIRAAWQADLEDFKRRRAPFLLYP
jgi:uncharacterized protein YbbC (DUF1343 family)